MTDNQITVAMEKFGPRLSSESKPIIVKQMQEAEESCMDTLMLIQMKSATVTLLLAIFLGGFGAPRFYIKHNELGGARLAFTIIGPILVRLIGHFLAYFVVIGGWIVGLISLVWHIVDCVMTFKGCRKRNYEMLYEFLASRKKKPSVELNKESA